MKIVTSGSSYLDIDGYACCIAYTELLNLTGDTAIAVTSAPFNYSISKSILALGKIIGDAESAAENPAAEAIIMDVSDQRFFDPAVRGRRIAEVYDHHVGFEDYWRDKLGCRAKIEYIGCAATLIFEEWVKMGLFTQMSPSTAKILVAAILDNTLNFTASVTHQRDIDAKEKLCGFANISQEWCASYFNECQEAIEFDLKASIMKDAKTDCDIPGLPKTIAQVTIWNADKLLKKRTHIYRVLNELSPSWMFNIISIQDGKGYVVCNDVSYRLAIQEIFSVQFTNDVALMEKAMLRKEIIKVARDYAHSSKTKFI
jgi:inorganic pyrophosphatase/exopolyphosphatase